ncbi:ATP-binding protein [Pontibacter toksunensis]|uniref:histidine kinase n=1 Tax=Pontibacter toksunensis TaxID=1332631 RepID=A0ABW6BN99_9BACT
MKKVFTLFFILFTAFAIRQALGADSKVFHLHQLPARGVFLDEGWKYQIGDNYKWAESGYDDSSWRKVNPLQDIHSIPQFWQAGIGWFRLQLAVDSAVRQQSLVLMIEQTGATEVYLNGHLIQQIGKISYNPKEVEAHTLPKGHMIALPLNDKPIQTLAIRYALQKGIPYLRFGDDPNWVLRIRVNEVSAAAKTSRADDLVLTPFEYFRAGLFFILAVIHLAFFWFYPVQKANLYFFIYAFLTAISSCVGHLANNVFLVETKMYLLVFNLLIGLIINYIFYIVALYTLFNLRQGVMFWTLTAGLILVFPMCFWLYNEFALITKLFFFLISLESIRITIIAIKRRKRGARVIAGGALAFFIFFSLFTAMSYGYVPVGSNWFYGILAFNLSVLSFPVAVSLFLALEFAITSRTLGKKLVQVQQLSAKTLAQEHEKQQILTAQNETLERQVLERTAEVVAQKEEIQHALEYVEATQAQLVQKEKMASLGELTAGIAHEIQNPLNFVNNFSEVSTELLQELEQEIGLNNREEAMVLTSDIRQNLYKIHHHGCRADAIVKNMLQHSRSSAGVKQLTDLNSLAEEYLRLAYLGIRNKHKDFNCTLDTCLDSSLEKVEVVPQELGRVLLNIFNNAFYSVQQKQRLGISLYKPKVTVQTQQMVEQLEIRVQDNGIGMPESVKSKIFQPFFTTKPAGQGTGLGLSLSYDIITKGHGGELKVESEVGEWAEFIIRVPLSVAVGQEVPIGPGELIIKNR